MNRRTFLGLIGVTTIGGTLTLANTSIRAKEEDMMKVAIEKLELSKSAWKEKLNPEQYHVLREEGTERPFSSPLNKEYGKGTYVCAGCDLPLFTSDTKFDSGTGWPSFWTSIEGHTETRTDFKLIFPRTEYHCSRCGGHQGHVFNDGPQPTGQRWCNNGVALRFVPESSAS